MGNAKNCTRSLEGWKVLDRGLSYFFLFFLGGATSAPPPYCTMLPVSPTHPFNPHNKSKQIKYFPAFESLQTKNVFLLIFFLLLPQKIWKPELKKCCHNLEFPSSLYVHNQIRCTSYLVYTIECLRNFTCYMPGNVQCQKPGTSAILVCRFVAL